MEVQALIEGEQTNNNLGLFSNDANHITVNSAESIDLPTTALNSISNEITVSFWINGNANVLPQNTTIIEGYDANNYRTLNIHFPWSNGRMYWDCGNSGTSSYDRIDKAASLSEYTRWMESLGIYKKCKYRRFKNIQKWCIMALRNWTYQNNRYCNIKISKSG